jgi:hypothetical protein
MFQPPTPTARPPAIALAIHQVARFAVPVSTMTAPRTFTTWSNTLRPLQSTSLRGYVSISQPKKGRSALPPMKSSVSEPDPPRWSQTALCCVPAGSVLLMALV